MGEKFAANPVTGTGSAQVPLYTSPGRAGFGPQLSLGYDSGAANGACGFGWDLSVPSIARKTEKGLPRYRDAVESDTFIMSGAEDLVPVLTYTKDGWARDPSSRPFNGQQYIVHAYRPRVEGLFARIERWVNAADTQDVFWRSISKDNLTTWYGRTPQSRITDPADPHRIFRWLISETYDDKGNVIVYNYKAEDSTGVDLSQASERNRTDLTRSAQRYLKSVCYGNRTPYFPDLTAATAVAQPTDWCFQVVFDFGEHDLSVPLPQETAAWICRADPFSSYRAAFEVRTYRLCRRVLMFHHFPNDPVVGINCLVRSTDLQHATPPASQPWQPFYSYLLSATQTGYVRQGTGYRASTLPPVEFVYTEARIDETVQEVDQESLRNVPAGLAAERYRWIDLDGEGVSGILTQQGTSWYYKSNLSPANRRIVEGERRTVVSFGPMQRVGLQPASFGLSLTEARLMDLSGDGRLDVVDVERPNPGYFERTEHEGWETFHRFSSLPVLDWRNPNLRWIDLTGDGFPDLLLAEDNVWWWHPSHSVEGFGPAQRISAALDEEQGPRLVFADSTESIFLADMSGDGLTDVVRVRNGEICYWPNLGYGRFGAKVAMDGAPEFDHADLFDGRRLQLADIDGSGTSDLVYFGSDGIQLYFNQSGDAWGSVRTLEHFPAVESLSAATVIDLLGNGTACLVWSSPLPANSPRPMRYIDLMGGQKPHLLVRSRNNLGAETVAHYAPSTRFYVADKLAGTPWLTRLPFPVHVLEKVESYDYISRSRFVTRYAYHHGYYDGVEREFRGFGCVDQWDTEELGTLSQPAADPPAANQDPAFSVPPVWTKTWYHTGAYFGEPAISKHFEAEYYSEGDFSDGVAGLTPQQLEAMRLPDTMLPSSVFLQDGSRLPATLSPEEMREACRALRGSILRQEVYALDGSDQSDRPYTASERNYTLEMLQPRAENRYAVFHAHARESLDYYYERTLYEVANGVIVDQATLPVGAVQVADPRVTHAVTLEADPYGNVVQSATIAYGRRYKDPALSAGDQAIQSTLLATYVSRLHTNVVLENDSYRAPLPAQSSQYEILQLVPDSTPSGITNLLRFEELQTKIASAGDGSHDIPYENVTATGLTAGQIYRRLIGCARSYYRPDDMGAAANDVKALLPLQKLESRGLAGISCKLAFTAGLLTQIYERDGTSLLPVPANVLGSTASDGGGYMDMDGNGNWWAPSGRAYFLPTLGTPAQEQAEALNHFFLPKRFEDPFGNAGTVSYDTPNDLMVVTSTDAIGNSISAVNDYRVLAPSKVTDANGNRATASFDALGFVAGTAVMGKVTQNIGDSLDGFSPDLDLSQLEAFYQADDPQAMAATLLGNASTRNIYDPQRFYRSRVAAPNDPTRWQPVFAASLARETHVSDLTANQSTRIQIGFAYSDGYSRAIQSKLRAEPGPVVANGPTVSPRWIASGWTIFNNKGKPVRQYEPFFSQLTQGHQFEYGVQVGVSPILCYDPVLRVIATIRPDHSWDKVVFDPWKQQAWDANDTVLQTDPSADTDVGGYFQQLPQADYLPTWYTQRSGGALGSQEQDAAVKAAVHANTPAMSYVDPLGRKFLSLAHNRYQYSDSPTVTDESYGSRIAVDVQNHERQLADALGRTIIRYDYDMLGTRIHQSSMEAGERWSLGDIAGNAIRSWDGRAQQFRTLYDSLRRPVAAYLQQGTNTELLVNTLTYGEGRPTPESSNLRGKPYQICDQAGVSITDSYDFKGNLLHSRRQLAVSVQATTASPSVPAYRSTIDWSAVVVLDSVSYDQRAIYDALNRPIQLTVPHGSATGTLVNVVEPVYNEAALLDQVHLWLGQSAEPVSLLDASTATLHAVTNIDYDAKRQRQQIVYGSGVTTSYTYDPNTFRLQRLQTTRSSDHAVLQDLGYTYDPVANVTHIDDASQQTVYFRNTAVDPACDYRYDALYRLIEATGREHLGQGGQSVPNSYNDMAFIGLPQPGDANAMGRYLEQYVYDAVGNFLSVKHQGSSAANPGWTRIYTYTEASLLEPAKQSNRLTSTAVGATTETYSSGGNGYDPHGNLLRMPQLQALQWDYRDQLQMTQRQAINADDADGTQHKGERTWYVYDGNGQRVRKVTELANGNVKDERLYLGGFEIYRSYGVNALTRETLHVMDGQQRVALIETRTQGNDPSPAQLIRYQHTNLVGSACLELDSQAQIISYEEYTPYGSSSYQAVRSQTETPKRYRYAGLERDDETGLGYHGARYYAAWLGRWTSTDPTGLAADLNLYAYCRNNPVGLSDPGGMDPDDPEYAGSRSDTLSDFHYWNTGDGGFIVGEYDALTLQQIGTFAYYKSRQSKFADSFYDEASQSWIGNETIQVSGKAPADNGGFFGGVWDGAVGLVKGVGHMVRHPVQTVETMGSMVAHPIRTAKNLGHAAWDMGGRILSGDTHALGELDVNLVPMLLAPEAEADELVDVGVNAASDAGMNASRAAPTVGPPSAFTDAVEYSKQFEAAGGERVFFAPAAGSQGEIFVARFTDSEILFDTETSADMVEASLNQLGQRNPGAHFHVGSGTHGDEFGAAAPHDPTLAEPGFFQEDLQTTASGNLTNLGPRAVYDVADPGGAAQFKGAQAAAAAAPKGTIFCVRGWCFSSVTRPIP